MAIVTMSDMISDITYSRASASYQLRQEAVLLEFPPVFLSVFLSVPPPLSYPSIRFRGIGVLLRD